MYYGDFWEYDPDTDAWTQKADFGGTVRAGTASFSIGTKGYIGTGYNDPIVYNDFYEYDPDTDAWTQKADFGGTARHGAVGFSIGTKGYIGTGSDYSQNDFWEYNPDTDVWIQRADFGGTARLSAVGFSIENKGYIGTGLNDSTRYIDFWEYTITTAADTFPDQFTFTDQAGVALSTVITSNTITVSGINAAAPISITGGTYSINGGPYTSDTGMVSNGNTITVQVTSSGSYSTTTNATLTIGGVSDTFSVTTLDDTTPEPFTFTDQTGVALSTVTTSNAITVSGINSATPISITGGTYSINGGAYTSNAGTVSNGNTVAVQVTSSGSYSTTTDATLTIGGVSDTFSVTTHAQDTVPDQFNFTDQTGVALSTVITSNTITVSGINSATPISITGGTYSVNGGAYSSNAGTVSNGNTVTVQVTSSPSYSTMTNTTLTIGGVSDTFSVTTQEPTEPIIQVTPGSLTFGYVPVGSTKDLTLTVKNAGVGTLTGSATTETPFIIISGEIYSLEADDSQVVTVQYQPTSSGKHTGIVNFTGGNGATIPLTGKTEKSQGLPWLQLLLGD